MKYVAFIECNASGTGVEAMKRVKERGIQVILLTQERDFYQTLESNPVEVADLIIDVNTSCVGSILNRIREYSLMGVVAFDDYRLITAAVVAGHLGLPAPDIDGLVNCRFKNQTRLAVSSGGVKSHVFNVLKAVDGQQLTYPCVVKPCDDSGSVGVRVCRDITQFNAAVDYIRRHRINVRGYQLSEEFLVEAFIEGDEFSAELIWSKSRLEWDLLGVTRKTVTPGEYSVELGHDFPASIPNEQGVAGQIKGWLREANLTGTVAHVEFKLCDGKAYLIEINPRPGGGMIHYLCHAVTGVDMVEAYLSLLIKDYVGRKQETPFTKAASIRFLMPDTAGMLTNIRVPQTDNPDILLCKVKKVPQLIESIASNYGRLGFVIAKGMDIEHSAQQANTFMHQIQIEMEAV